MCTAHDDSGAAGTAWHGFGPAVWGLGSCDWALPNTSSRTIAQLSGPSTIAEFVSGSSDTAVGI